MYNLFVAVERNLIAFSRSTATEKFYMSGLSIFRIPDLLFVCDEARDASSYLFRIKISVYNVPQEKTEHPNREHTPNNAVKMT